MNLLLMADVVHKGSTWMPDGASTISGDIDWLFYFILYVCYFFTALIFVLAATFAWRYRVRDDMNEVGRGPSHNLVLELGWSIAPGIILMLIFVWGFTGYMNMAVLPPKYQTAEIHVEAWKWGWQFTYPNGYQDSELHLVKGQPVRIILESRDVIHSLYMPNFRLKKDVVPGRYNSMWVEPTKVSPLKEGLSYDDPLSFDPVKGDASAGFQILCAEYCGQGHSQMRSRIHVHPDQASFDAWLKAASDIDKRFETPVLRGQYLGQSQGCFGCHSVDGSAKVGPSWKNLYGRSAKWMDGASYTADENYIHESILYPGKHIVAGYTNAMPAYVGKLSDKNIGYIIAYMKSISDNYKGSLSDINAAGAPATAPATGQETGPTTGQAGPTGGATGGPIGNTPPSIRQGPETSAQPETGTTGTPGK